MNKKKFSVIILMIVKLGEMTLIVIFKETNEYLFYVNDVFAYNDFFLCN